MPVVQFTLYEVFGYAFPGAFGLLGVFLAFWRLFLQPHQDLTNLSPAGWWLVFGMAYIFGHILQAIANWAFGRRSWRPEFQLFNSNHLPENLKCMLVKRAQESVGVGRENELKPEMIYEIADNFVLQNCKTEARDIYIYREGFYRGMSVGILFLGIGVLFQVGWEFSIKAAGVEFILTSSSLFFIAAISVSMAVLFLFRYFRFARYRVKYSLYSFLNGRGE